MAIELRIPSPATSDNLPAGSIFLAYDQFRVRICVSLGAKGGDTLYALVLAGTLGQAPEKLPYPQVVEFGQASRRTQFAQLQGDFIVAPLTDIRLIPPSIRPEHGDLFTALNGVTGVYTAVDDGPGTHISLTGEISPVQKPVHYYRSWKIILRTPDTVGDHHYMELFRREWAELEPNGHSDARALGLFQLIREAGLEPGADLRTNC